MASKSNTTKEIVFIVAKVLAGGAMQPVFRGDDDKLLVFNTPEEAREEIRDCITSIADAIEEGHMQEDSREENDEYWVLIAEKDGDDLTIEVSGRIFKMNLKDEDWTFVSE
jgi:hypothetical protein